MDPPSESAACGGLFPTTRWTIVRELSDGERRVRFLAWDEFVSSYGRPLRVWLTGRCRDTDLAEEVVQSFLVKIQAKEHSVANLAASKGKLRSWLRVSLKNHWLDHLRREGPAKLELSDEIAASSTTGDEDFDREWALSIARRVLVQIQEEYAARNSAPLFNALLEVIDDPGREVRPECCRRLGMLPNTFAVALMRFRERLLVRLREEVGATVVGGEVAEVDSELRYLVTILSRHGALSSVVSDA